MSELRWHEMPGELWQVDGLGAEVQVRRVWLEGAWRWQWWCMAGGGGVCETQSKAQIAALGVYRARLQGQLDGVSALIAAIKQAAQDADDAALVAAHGEVVWAVRDAGFATLHTATVAGHPCCVTEYREGNFKWELEPEYYGHPLTWDAPDLETAKMRAAAAALREPCKRWRVTLPAQGRGIYRLDGGEVEVWAVTREGALYRAAAALSAKIYCMGIIGEIEGEAVEVAG